MTGLDPSLFTMYVFLQKSPIYCLLFEYNPFSEKTPAVFMPSNGRGTGRRDQKERGSRYQNVTQVDLAPITVLSVRVEISLRRSV